MMSYGRRWNDDALSHEQSLFPNPFFNVLYSSTIAY